MELLFGRGAVGRCRTRGGGAGSSPPRKVHPACSSRESRRASPARKRGERGEPRTAPAHTRAWMTSAEVTYSRTVTRHRLSRAGQTAPRLRNEQENILRKCAKRRKVPRIARSAGTTKLRFWSRQSRKLLESQTFITAEMFGCATGFHRFHRRRNWFRRRY